MKEVVFATSNESKLKRFKSGLEKKGIKLLSLNDEGVSINVNENGNSAIENACLKAYAGHVATQKVTIRMDDSLYLCGVPDNLQPGLFVRRVSGRVLSDKEMIEHYISLVNQYGTDGKLPAKWVYGMALVDINGNIHTYTWEKGGFYLTNKQSDIINPGYPLNSISKYEKINKYFTDITKEDKIPNIDESDVIDFIASHV